MGGGKAQVRRDAEILQSYCARAGKVSYVMAMSDRPVYSIGAVSRLLGVPATTLRTWQERYGVVVPERSEGGHRLYTRDQLALLRFVTDQVTAGLSPGDAHRLLR
jgi:hypothetical protein